MSSACPQNESGQGCQCNDEGSDERRRVGKAERSVRDEKEVADDNRHEERRNEGEPVALMFLEQIDGADPKRHSGHQLRPPSYVLPYGAEARWIAYLPSQQGDTYGEHG